MIAAKCLGGFRAFDQRVHDRIADPRQVAADGLAGPVGDEVVPELSRGRRHEAVFPQHGVELPPAVRLMKVATSTTSMRASIPNRRSEST